MENPHNGPLRRTGFDARSSEESGLQLKTDLDVLKSRYEIVVELDQVLNRRSDRLGLARSISYDTVPYLSAALPVRTIREELGLYPPEYIHALRLRRIKPVRNITESSFLIGQIQEIGGIPVLRQGLMYLDLGLGTDMVTLIQNLHHELSHFSDGDISAIRGRRKRKEWVDLNPTGSKSYRIVEEYFSNRDIDAERPEGFASLYGTFSPEEDRAEVAQLVMTMGRAPGYLKNIMQKDEVLRAKILARLAAFNEKAGDKIGSSYLDDLERRVVNEKYWDLEVNDSSKSF